jgi:exonuclease III
MLKPGKKYEIADQMLKTQLQIFALQEIRWKGSGQLKKDKYSLYYSCSHQNTGQLGTGFMVKREVVKNIVALQSYNEEICKLRLRGKYHNLTSVNVHAPTSESRNNSTTIFKDCMRIPQHMMQ